MDNISKVESSYSNLHGGGGHHGGGGRRWGGRGGWGGYWGYPYPYYWDYPQSEIVLLADDESKRKAKEEAKKEEASTAKSSARELSPDEKKMYMFFGIIGVAVGYLTSKSDNIGGKAGDAVMFGAGGLAGAWIVNNLILKK